MSDSSDRPTPTRRPVTLRVEAMGPAPAADALIPVAANSARTHTRPLPDPAARPRRPFERPHPGVERSDDGGPSKRVFSTWQSSQTGDAAQQQHKSVPVPPRTRYRFGAALTDGRAPDPPPDPCVPGASNDSVRAAAWILRNIVTATRTIASQYAGRTPGHAAPQSPDPASDTPHEPAHKQD
jgi:hypothetical protein